MLGFENEGSIGDESDLRKRVEATLPSEITALIEARPEIIGCLSAGLRERFRVAETFGGSNMNLEAPYADMAIFDDMEVGQNPFDDI